MSAYESTPMMRRALSPAERLDRVGAGLLRWSLVLLLVLFGVLKWTAEEAAGIHAFIANSPILFWIDRAFGQQGASELIGVMELTTAALFASRRWSPRLALVGGLLGIGTFLTTLSFIVTTPNVANSFPFLVKDLTLLGAATWLAGEAWGAVVRGRS